MRGNQHENIDEVLDIGSTLKKEKIFRENQEKIAKLKTEHAKEENKETQEAKASIKQICIFLLCIILIAVGVRLYVASMPVTEEWATLVVSESVKNQVTEIIYDDYPTLSDAKKQELIIAQTKQELATEQGQNAIKKLAETYKESYKDQQGSSYLYEIDHYYFYEIANDQEAVLDVSAHNLLAFLERWTFSLVSFFMPDATFVRSIFYLPILFTIFCGIFVFFMTREIWNELAGFIAALFFVLQPIILEFSIPGFVDTNMLNIFFILLSGFLFVKIVDSIKKGKIQDYCFAGILFLLLYGILIVFRYNWSTWYITLFLFAGALGSFFILQFFTILRNWKHETTNTKYITGAALCALVLFCFFAVWYADISLAIIHDKIIPLSVKKYLHLEYEDPYGQWPDAFALIKELKTTDLSSFIGYLGGNLFIVISFPVAFYLLYLMIKRQEIKWCYFIGAYIVFFLLSFRAIRVLPYFIPFFAGTFGIGLSIVIQYVIEKTKLLLKNEKKTVQHFSVGIVVLVLALPFAYPLMLQDLEKSNLMPIMDDAIYNSALFIKEQSHENATISTWWDRGIFYKALAAREVHLHSQPHMPTTYWLAAFYATENEIQAANIIKMMNCEHRESAIFDSIRGNFTKKQKLEIMKEMLGRETKEEQGEYINNTYMKENESIEDYYATSITDYVSCGTEETYIVLIDDLMPRYSAVQYFAAWDFETQQPDPTYPYTDLIEGGCGRLQSGAYCSLEGAQFFLNFTSLDVLSNVQLPREVYLVNNNTVQYKDFNNQTTSEMTLIVYQRAGYWKMLYVPTIVADSMYVQLMVLDGYNLDYFEKVFDEVHAETSWVKVYKMNW